MQTTDMYEGRDLEAMAGLSRYYTWILETFKPFLRGYGIELGAGQGTMSQEIRPYLEYLDLVEPSGNLYRFLERKFSSDPRVRLINSTLEKHLAHSQTNSRDVAVMVNVLEHIEDDQAALIDIAKLLKPGGYLLIFVPALQMLFSDFDRLVGHHRRYHKDQLRKVAENAGFEIISVKYCDILGVLPWFFLNRMMGSTTLNPSLIKIYDTLGTPLTRIVEKIVPVPFGKNLILVARRPTQVGL